MGLAKCARAREIGLEALEHGAEHHRLLVQEHLDERHLRVVLLGGRLDDLCAERLVEVLHAREPALPSPAHEDDPLPVHVGSRGVRRSGAFRRRLRRARAWASMARIGSIFTLVTSAMHAPRRTWGATSSITLTVSPIGTATMTRSCRDATSALGGAAVEPRRLDWISRAIEEAREERPHPGRAADDADREVGLPRVEDAPLRRARRREERGVDVAHDVGRDVDLGALARRSSSSAPSRSRSNDGRRACALSSATRRMRRIRSPRSWTI